MCLATFVGAALGIDPQIRAASVVDDFESIVLGADIDDPSELSILEVI
jgi:hypothetical protein